MTNHSIINKPPRERERERERVKLAKFFNLLKFLKKPKPSNYQEKLLFEKTSNKVFVILNTAILVSVIVIVIIAVAKAWTNPTANPPSGGGALYYYNGNVGIGTTGPNSKLEVAGTIHSITGGFKFPDNTTQTTAATGQNSCSWVKAGPGVTTAGCSGGMVAIAGGCQADGFADRGLVDSRPNPGNCTGNNCTGWYCGQSQGASTVYVRCCPL